MTFEKVLKSFSGIEKTFSKISKLLYSNPKVYKDVTNLPFTMYVIRNTIKEIVNKLILY
tara:strand:- start:627 stop:803 length:177 start_codon:yes stop_codon:yes gene_type:complete